MLKKKKSVVSFVVCFFLLPLLVLFGFFYYQGRLVKAPSKTTDELFLELRSLYVHGKFNEAKLEIESSLNEILAFEEGCDLIISVYARLKDYQNLETYSKTCLHKTNTSGIAYEGLAMSSLGLKKEKETLLFLGSLLEKGHKHDRLLVALAQLSYEQKDDVKARQYFKDLIKNSKLWSAWVLRIIQYDRLFQDKNFVKEFTLLVSTKKNIPKKATDHLLAHAKRHNLNQSIQALTKNLEENMG